MNIAYCYNDGNNKVNEEQVLLFGASLLSLKNTHENYNICVYIIIYKIHNAHLKKIKSILEKISIKYKIIYFPDNFQKELKYMMEKSTPANEGTFLRLFLGELLPNAVEKILYVDTDTIFNKCIYEEYLNTPLHKYSLGAVLDPYSPFSRQKERELGLTSNSYFNAGILLINIKKIRSELLTKTMNVFYKHSNIFADQDSLNIAFNKDTLLLDSSFNNIVDEYYNESAFIHHYAARGKLLHIKPAIIHSDYITSFWYYINQVSTTVKKPKIHLKNIINYILYKFIPKKIIIYINNNFLYK